jgi:uncharacterized protein YfaT (DUF1175 family)
VGKRKRPVKSLVAEVYRLKGRRKGGVLKDEAWWEGAQVVAYNLAYINRRICRVDHGRVLGYDNSHGYHHRHFMGKTEAVEYISYDALVERFYQELHELWRAEDAKD